MNSFLRLKLSVSIILMIPALFLSGSTHAQTGHMTCAFGCELSHTSKLSVSCIDAICTICHEKQKKEREKKKQEEKLAEEKRKQEEVTRKAERVRAIEEQKKQIAIQRQKARENELVLVAPGSSGLPAPPPKSTRVLDAKDREILELAKTKTIQARYYSGNEYFNGKFVDFPTPECHIFYEEDKTITLLKKINLKTPVPFETVVFTTLLESGYFIAQFNPNRSGNYYDLIDLSGNALFKDPGISTISDRGENYLLIGKKTQAQSGTDYYEMYNTSTQQKYPFPEGLVSNWGYVNFSKKTNTSHPHSELIIQFIDTYLRKQSSINLMFIWDMVTFRKKGFEFYDNYKLSSGPQKGESLKSNLHGKPPRAFLENKDNCLLMFMIWHDIAPKNYDDNRNQLVRQLSMYGFDPVKGKYMLIDNIPFNSRFNQYHILTQYWFGQMK